MNQQKKIFGVPVAEIDRQLAVNPLSVDQNSPIRAGEFLEPCIRGGEKILKNKKKKMLMRDIYRGL